MLLVFEILLLFLKIFLCFLEAIFRAIVPRSPKDVSGKVVLVTGAGRGIGKELALKFGQLGAKVVVWDVGKDDNEATATDINESGGFAKAYVCDVSRWENVKEVASKVKREVGNVDILVNNAGVMYCKTILNLTEKDIRKTMEVNTIAHFWTVKEFLPHMMETDTGHVVTIASMAATQGTALETDYSASKFAVFGFAEALEAEMKQMGKTGIRFTTVCPMFVNTHLIQDLPDKMVQVSQRFGEMLSPHDVAEDTVLGVRRNQHFVFIPASMASALFLRCFPYRAKQHILDFLQSGFYIAQTPRPHTM